MHNFYKLSSGGLVRIMDNQNTSNSYLVLFRLFLDRLWHFIINKREKKQDSTIKLRQKPRKSIVLLIILIKIETIGNKTS